MSRAGRKRKLVEREPNGRAQRALGDPCITVRDQRIARGANLDNWRAQEHSTPLGRMFMAGAFDHPLNTDTAKRRYDAGVWYRGLWLAKQRALSLPQPHVRSPGAPTGKGRDIDPDDAMKAIQRETRALNCVPRGAKAVIYSVIVLESEDWFAAWGPVLTAALDALAFHQAGA